MRPGNWLGLFCVLSAVGATTPSFAQQGGQEKGWRFEVAPYIWAAGMEGSITTDQGTAVLDTPWGDIVEALDSGGVLHFEGRNGGWGFLTDFVYLRIKDDTDKDVLGTFEARLETTIGEAAAFKRFGHGDTSWDLIFGGRGIKLDNQIDVSDSAVPGFDGAKIEGDRGWVDAMVGARVNTRFNDSWSMTNRLDFSAGGSDLTWQIASTLRWEFSEHMSLGVGFRVLDVDYEDDDDNLEFEPQYAGLTIGLGIRFP